MDDLAFYCVCDGDHFIGLVALVNSLRLLGHDEPIHVLDCGLENWQREALAADGNVRIRARDQKWHPMLLKTVLPLAEPAAVMVVADVDIIFGERLDVLVARTRATGRPLLFPDIWSDRFDDRWEALGFGAPAPHEYVASGQFILPAESGTVFLRQWAEGLARFAADPALSDPSIAPETNPFRFPDMDVLNALIGTLIELDSYDLARVETAAYPPFSDVDVVDAHRLRLATRSGADAPILLHHFMGKPWNHLVAPNPYSQLMIRLLCSSDVSVRIPKTRIPPSLQNGVRGMLARRYVMSRLLIRSMRARVRTRRAVAVGPAAPASGASG